ESLDQALRALVNRMLKDPKARGVNSLVINKMRGEFLRWGNVQLILNAQFPHEELKSVPNLHPGRKVIPAESADWDEFSKVNQLLRPLFNDKEPPRVILVPQSRIGEYGVAHGFTSLSVMNLERSVLSLVYRGYSGEQPPASVWDYGIKSHEMQAFY